MKPNVNEGKHRAGCCCVFCLNKGRFGKGRFGKNKKPDDGKPEDGKPEGKKPTAESIVSSMLA